MARRLIGLGAAIVLLCSGLLMGGSAGDGYLWWEHREPIYIYGDRGFTRENGVVAGCGTQQNPYIIEAWRIVPKASAFGIYIDHTTCHFVIRNCMIEGAREAAIHFNSVSNGRIEGCQLLRNECGILLENSHYNALVGNLIAENRCGVRMQWACRENTVVENSFIWNGLAGHDPERRTMWYCGCRGNFWSDYEGCDYNRDGIGDRPYSSLGDPYPLMSSPMGAALPLTYQSAGHCRVSTGLCELGSWRDLNCDGVPDPCVPQQHESPRAPCIPPVGGCMPEPICEPATDPCLAQPMAPLPPVSPPAQGPVPCPPTDPCLSAPDGAEQCDGTQLVVGPVTPITLYAHDDLSGLAGIYFTIDGGTWTPYQGPFTLTGLPGMRMIAYYAVDRIGNRSSVQSFCVVLDPCPPELMYQVGEPSLRMDGLMLPVSEPCDGQPSSAGTDADAAEAAPADGSAEPPAVDAVEEAPVPTAPEAVESAPDAAEDTAPEAVETAPTQTDSDSTT
jgi:parallel beta-helix repeat protein